MSVLCYLVSATHLHVDHVVRHNAVGWPLTDQVNAFTASLGIYPVIAAGLLADRAGRVGTGFGRWSPAAAPCSSAAY